MKKINQMMIGILLILSLSVTGCTQSAVISGSDLMANVEAAAWPENPAEPEQPFTDAVSDFSWKMMQHVQAESGNLMLSPASIFLALAMTLNGADGQTRDDMLAALAASDLSVEQINTEARNWLINLQQTDGDTQLNIANSIWFRQDYKVDRLFLQKNADYFAAAARGLDFDDSSAVSTINQWIDDATEGTIDQIIDSIDNQDVMFLINAIYFNAKWHVPFEADQTRSGTFNAPTAEVEVDFMNRHAPTDYLALDNAEGVLLPYSDGRYAFIALLPDEEQNPRDLARSLDGFAIQQMIRQKQSRSIQLALPKFESEFEISLQDALSQLGMASAFDPAEADFSMITADRQRNLYIEEVKHKTFIRVDELGTEAAAVTSVEMRVTSMPESDLNIRFDRPFLYCIIDLQSYLPLFIGVMENPAG